MPFRILLPLILPLLLASCSAGGGVYHTVSQGQTLYTISRTYNVDESYLARINGISDPRLLKTGQELYIPGADRSRPVPVTATGRSVSKPTPPSTGSKAADRGQTSRKSPEKATRARPPAASPADSSPKPQTSRPPPKRQGRFVWPARGSVLTEFGKHGEGFSKGVEIALEEGSQVVSSAAGKVIYSGNGISGYGNLVIVRHDESFFTVYGYNRRNLVETGAFVSRGQKIALSGTPPKGGKARLYFEIRHGKKAVDPIFYLP